MLSFKISISYTDWLLIGEKNEILDIIYYQKILNLSVLYSKFIILNEVRWRQRLYVL